MCPVKQFLFDFSSVCDLFAIHLCNLYMFANYVGKLKRKKIELYI